MNILLTGSTRGIGAACADALTAAGATVIGHGTRSEVAADLAEPGAAQRLWDQALDQANGHIDVLVNNAGVFEANPLDADHDAWVAGWERTMRVNLTAAAELSRLAVLHWQATAGGRLINVASRAAYRGDSPAHWHYAASKAGMVAMTKTIARGYARDGVLAFAVCPGFTMTGMAEDYLSSRGGEQLLADIPLGRVAEPAEVAAIVKFCAFDAPPSMTGAVLDINGASYVR